MRYLIFLAVFIIAYLVYVLTWPPTVFWQDAGIYLTAIKVLGIVYPPGFPLYVMLGHLWTKILPWGNFVQKVHAFSAVWGAGTAGLMALCALEIFHLRGVSLVSPSEEPLRVTVGGGTRSFFHLGGVVASLTIGLTTAFSYSLWAQAINAEVYSFHAFFTAGFLYLMVKLFHPGGVVSLRSQHPRGDQRGLPGGGWIWLLLAVVLGLSFANHPLAITFLVAIGYLLYQNRRIVIKRWPFFLLLGLIFLACGFLPYLYLPIRAKVSPALNWGDPSTLKRFLRHVTGGGGYLAPFSLDDFAKLERLKRLFWEEFFILPIIFGFLGLGYLLKKNRELFGILGILGVSVVVLFYLYTKGEDFWLIPFYLVFILLFAFGLRWFLLKIKDQGLALLVGVMIGLFSVIPLLGFNWLYLNRSDYYTAADFGRNILRPLEKDSVLFIIGDQPSSTVLYLQKVEDFRPDVVVFYPGEEVLINEFVDQNSQDHAIYFLSLKSLPEDFPFPLIAAGAFWKVSTDENEVIDEKYWDFQFTDPQFFKKSMKKEERKKIYLADGRESYLTQSYHQGLIDFLAQAYKNLGDWYYVRGDCEKAVESYEKIFVYNKDFEHEEVMRNLEVCKIK